MSPGNLFHYFPNKQAMIEAIAEHDRREMSERFAQLADEPDAMVVVERLAKDILKQCTILSCDEGEARRS